MDKLICFLESVDKNNVDYHIIGHDKINHIKCEHKITLIANCFSKKKYNGIIYLLSLPNIKSFQKSYKYQVQTDHTKSI